MINRDRQIEMMRDYDKRLDKRFEKLLRVPVIRDTISRAHTKQDRKKAFVVRSVRAVKPA